MGPNVKILMGQSFGSWTHGHGPMALGPWALVLAPGAPGTTHFPGCGPGPGPMGDGPMPRCSGAKALAHEYFDIWAHEYFWPTRFLAYLIFSTPKVCFFVIL